MSTTAVQGIPDAPLPPVENPVPPNLAGQSQGGVSAEPAKSADREYVVLKASKEDTVWELITSIEATSSEQAIRRAIEKPGTSFLNSEGTTTLVAVPSRSWNPSSVAVKTETSIVFS